MLGRPCFPAFQAKSYCVVRLCMGPVALICTALVLSVVSCLLNLFGIVPLNCSSFSQMVPAPGPHSAHGLECNADVLTARCLERKPKNISKRQEKALFQGLTTSVLVSVGVCKGAFPSNLQLRSPVAHHFQRPPMYKPGFMDPLA